MLLQKSFVKSRDSASSLDFPSPYYFLSSLTCFLMVATCFLKAASSIFTAPSPFLLVPPHCSQHSLIFVQHPFCIVIALSFQSRFQI